MGNHLTARSNFVRMYMSQNISGYKVSHSIDNAKLNLETGKGSNYGNINKLSAIDMRESFLDKNWKNNTKKNAHNNTCVDAQVIGYNNKYILKNLDCNIKTEYLAKTKKTAKVKSNEKSKDKEINMNIINIVRNFDIDGEFVAYQPYGNGHINDTFALTFKFKKKMNRFILQKINENVFSDVEMLMNNIGVVTEFIRNKIIAAGGDPERECLRMHTTRTGKLYYTDENNNKWRVMKLIENTEAYQNAVDPHVFEMTGKAFGEFIRMLDDFPVDQIKEVIPDFHNTLVRYETFLRVLKDNPCKRRRYCRQEVKFALSCQPFVDRVVNLLKNNEIPMRVTHNDTKINNLLVDSRTGEAVCVIDLDTIMPGSLIYDFGDGIRSGCNTAMEDEKNLDLVDFNMEMFEYFSKGFIEGVGEALTKTEKDHLAYGAILITFECGLRFLTDYLNGDKYFRTSYSNHNLIRCRTQFKLVREMEQRMGEMNKIISKY